MHTLKFKLATVKCFFFFFTITTLMTSSRPLFSCPQWLQFPNSVDEKIADQNRCVLANEVLLSLQSRGPFPFTKLPSTCLIMLIVKITKRKVTVKFLDIKRVRFQERLRILITDEGSLRLCRLLQHPSGDIDVPLNHVTFSCGQQSIILVTFNNFCFQHSRKTAKITQTRVAKINLDRLYAIASKDILMLNIRIRIARMWMNAV